MARLDSGYASMAGRTVNIYLANHAYNTQETLRDFCVAYGGALSALGHPVVFSPVLLRPPAINLVFEHFDDRFVGLLEPVLPGYHLGLICTEPFAGNPFSELGYRQMRTANMIRIGAGCRFVWCVDGRSFASHKAAFGHSRVYPTPIGYSAALADLHDLPPEDKLWDVCFTGTVTPYRQRVLEQVAAAGLKVISGLYPHFVRRSIMHRSRLHLTLKQDEELSLPSQLRMAYCLSNDLPIVSDLGGRQPETLAETYVTAVAPDALAQWCVDFVAGRQDVGAMRAKIAAFKSECRMDVLNAEVIRASFAACP